MCSYVRALVKAVLTCKVVKHMSVLVHTFEDVKTPAIDTNKILEFFSHN